MKKPEAAQTELAALAAKVKATRCWTEPFPTIPYELYQTAIDLMYRGNEDAGWKFIELAWNPTNPRKGEFIDGLKSRLAKSLYWAELAKR